MCKQGVGSGMAQGLADSVYTGGWEWDGTGLADSV